MYDLKKTVEDLKRVLIKKGSSGQSADIDNTCSYSMLMTLLDILTNELCVSYQLQDTFDLLPFYYHEKRTN